MSFTIVIVDDDPEDVFIIKECIRIIDPQIVCQELTESMTALTFLTTITKLPDLLILDIHMPKVNGWEILKKLRLFAQYANLPVLILTESGALTEQFKSIELNATFVTKPVSFDAQVKALSKVIAKVKSLKTGG